MLKTISMIAAAGAFLALASSAHAFSPAPANLPVPEVSGDVETVAGGCGRGWFRNRWGRCVPMAAAGPAYVVRPAVVCRTVRGPYGGWRRVCR